VHAAFLLVVLLALAPLAGHIPLASLAAILFVVAFNMSDAPHFARLVRRAPRADVAILLVTFVLTVFTDLVIAVNIGVILAMLQFLRRMSASVEVARRKNLYQAKSCLPESSSTQSKGRCSSALLKASNELWHRRTPIRAG
jgi:SulP family sulfate permease